MLYSGHLYIADTFSENQLCPLLRGFIVLSIKGILINCLTNFSVQELYIRIKRMNKIKVVLTLIRLSIDIKNTILQWNLSKADTIGTMK